ncbi:MAG: carboxypeptidase-like regulatory domain-containing protein [Breznakibacter sp.]
MKRLIFVLLAIAVWPAIVYPQTFTQTIRGTVTDQTTEQPLAFATVALANTNPRLGAVTDINGQFAIPQVPVGRYDIQVSFLGYEPVLIPEVLVTNAKETILYIKMREASQHLNSVEVKPRVQKEAPLNSMATVSARMFSVEEANRYAGGFDDPARLASAFAGVASTVNNNAIVVRGNAPKFMQWKLEGIEIPNPNHFADLAALGGGGLTALSSNLLANSDFLTGAFPAEYPNALSGVFDLAMRTGNNTSYEHSVQMGLIGIDATSEGPIGDNGRASYLVNYRYSTLGLLAPLLPDDADGTTYQDLSFKTKFPTKNLGVFTLWGIGLTDRSGQEAETDPAKWTYYQDKETANPKQYMGAMGLNHKWFTKQPGTISTTLAVSANGLKMFTQRMNGQAELLAQNKIDNALTTLTLKSVYERKYGHKHANKTGVQIQQLGFSTFLADAVSPGNLSTLVDQTGNTHLLSAFSSSSIQLSPVTLNVGATAQYLALNGQYTVEPRIGISTQIAHNQTLSLGYGLHSRLEPIHIYFLELDNGQSNKDLGFTKAYHWVLGYQAKLNDILSFKIETYYQQLFDVPVVSQTANSLLNQQNHWFIDNVYVNGGKGENAGVDLTLERYMKQGFYYLATASVFDSKYKTDTDGWHPTRYNRRFVVNLLAGKEWAVGPHRQNFLNVNARLGIQGGERYSPIDAEASAAEKDVVYSEADPFSKQTRPAWVTHLTVNYRWNKPKSSRELSLKLINANNYKEFMGHRINLKTLQVEEERQALMIPNLSYKISF